MPSLEPHYNQKDTTKLHEKQEFLDKLPEYLPDFVFWKNTESVYLGCNKNFADLLGFASPDEIVGKTDADLPWQAPGDTSEIFQASDREALTGEAVIGREETLMLPSGKHIETLLSKGRVSNNDGEALGVVGYFSDITEHKARERALRIAKREAEAAARTKSDFIANMSHDIRTPLAGIMGIAITAKDLLVTLQDDTIPANSAAASGMLLKAQEVVEMISQSAESLLAFLNAILELVQCERRQAQAVEQQVVNLPELLTDISQMMQPSMESKQLKFCMQGVEALPTRIMGDKHRLQQILLNLLGNAVKFTPQGKIELSVKLHQPTDLTAATEISTLELSVKDTGIGIPVDKQSEIFQAFVRVHPAYDGHYTGAGLGLTIVQEHVTALNGDIHVNSTVNEGSTFVCTIPIKLAKEVHDDHDNAQPLPSNDESSSLERSKPMSVLIVEDHDIAQRAVMALLSRFDCQMDTAATAKAAFEKAISNHYDVIFMDIGLPDGSGHQVTQSIRAWEAEQQRERPMFIVALTAHANLAACIDSGMQLAYQKPLRVTHVHDIMKRLGVDDQFNASEV